MMATNTDVNHAPKEFYQRRLAERTPALAFSQRGSQPVETWQGALRETVHDCLSTAPERVPVEAQKMEERDEGAYVREKWRLRTEPDFWLSFYLLIPKERERPAPAVIALPGHGPGKSRPAGIADTPEEREIVFGGERDYGLQAVKRGYIALCSDMRGFGESVDEDHTEINYNESCRYSSGRAIMLGRTLLGERVWDVSRAVDFLSERDDVDAGCIVCIGHSGGATVTIFAMAVEPRIVAGVASAYLCNWEYSIYGVGHCTCNYVPNLAQFANCGDVAGLAAPRPMLFVAGEQDPIFPIAGVHKAYDTVRSVYSSLGAEDRVRLYTAPKGHRFYKAPVWPFIAEWL